jgi:hypothetical protein
MAVKSKEPNVEVEWPPYGGTPKQVGPKDNWWTVQKDAGRGNVWDVIYFNFRSADSAEINWYMENYLGCNILSANKQSYKFGTRVNKKEVSPVTVYLPPPGWTPPYEAKLPPPPARPKMSDADGRLAEFVHSVLYNNALGWVDFHIGPLSVNYTDYRRIADMIRYGVIAVYSLPNSAETAEYDPESNALYVMNDRTLEDEAMIVHEATHAICDMKRLNNILTADDECAGYFAATIYVQKKMNSDRRVLHGGYDVYQVAFELYQKWIAGERLTYEFFNPLRQVIGTKSKYKGKIGSAAGYDGIFHG